MYVVGRNFYGRFLPQLREVAGADAEALIESHIGSLEQHAWLKSPEKTSPILGVGRPWNPDD
jgi:hypothetical protein